MPGEDIFSCLCPHPPPPAIHTEHQEGLFVKLPEIHLICGQKPKTHFKNKQTKTNQNKKLLEINDTALALFASKQIWTECTQTACIWHQFMVEHCRKKSEKYALAES